MSGVNLSPYKPGWANLEGQHYVNGPGQDYYGRTDTFDTEEQCQKATNIANESYRQGYLWAQREMQRALGIKS